MSKIRLHGTSSGYVEIAPAAAASNNTLTAPSTVGEIIAKDAAGAIGVTSVHTTNITATGIATITTAKIGAGVTISESGIEASGIGITCANINGTQIGGRRNIIINGDTRVAQRATSATSVSGDYLTVDRFSTAFGGADEAPTEAQHSLSTSDTPYALGFRKSFHYTNGNQTSGAGSSDYLQPQYKIEAQDLANCGWNYTSSTSFITLSFWVKSSVAGDYTCNFGTHDGTAYRYLMEYTLVADTWKHVVFKIPGNSNLTVNDDNGHGATIMWYPFLGSTYIQADQENNWYASSNSKYGTTSTTNWWTTNDATWEITGVQLEVGSQATAFEHRKIADELALCQRYYFKVMDGQTTSETLGYAGMVWQQNNGSIISIRYPVRMRATPSLEVTNGTQYWRSFSGNDLSNAYADGSGVVTNLTRTYGAEIYVNTSANTGGEGRGMFLRGNNTSASMAYEAEL